MNISENYLKITSPETGISYGGSQSWFPLFSMKKGGCGIIAAADMLLYLKGVRELSLNDYLRFADRIKKYFLTMGPLGMHGLALASGLNKAFKANKMKYKAKWVMNPSKLKASAEKMISQGIPVIFSIGPDFPLTLLSTGLNLYSKTAEGSFNKTSKARKHFMMLTGFEGEMASVSSWGRKYYIEWEEFEKIACTRSRFLTSILLIQKKK